MAIISSTSTIKYCLCNTAAATANAKNITYPNPQTGLSRYKYKYNSIEICCRGGDDCGRNKQKEKQVEVEVEVFDFERRQLLFLSLAVAASLPFPLPAAASPTSEFADMPALRGKDYGKSKMRFPDYTLTQSGLQFKDLKVGTGPSPKIGETVVVDWDGYTIGYYGRIFEARNKTKGGSFEGNDKDFFKFKIGSRQESCLSRKTQVIPAFEEAISGMSLGGIRRIIVPPDLGYPENDFNKKGPRPTTFSGQRALDFVLKNQGLIDKTLLFDIELLKIIRNY